MAVATELAVPVAGGTAVDVAETVDAGVTADVVGVADVTGVPDELDGVDVATEDGAVLVGDFFDPPHAASDPIKMTKRKRAKIRLIRIESPFLSFKPGGLE